MSKKLLFSITKKDFDIQYFSGTGAGGQHRNKHQNCVRLTHRDSGVTVTAQNSRSRQTNLREAFQSLLNKSEFQKWHKIECAKHLGTLVDIETWVQKELDENIKVEVFKDGRWQEVDNE